MIYIKFLVMKKKVLLFISKNWNEIFISFLKNFINFKFRINKIIDRIIIINEFFLFRSVNVTYVRRVYEFVCFVNSFCWKWGWESEDFLLL